MQIAEVDLVYKTKVKAKDRPRVCTSKEAYVLFLAHWDENKIELVEEFKMLLLNNDHRVLGICSLSKGGMSTAVVDQRLVFITALKAAASGIILCHNHPAKHMIPSLQDEHMTYQIRDGGKLLNIKIFDHLIICDEGYYSFADEGLL